MKVTAVTIVGNVAKEPTLRLTGDGTRVVNFRVATNERIWDRALGANRDGDTVFWSVSCWRNFGDNVLDSITVGQPVLVHGRLKVRSYEKDGVRTSTVEIDAWAVGHDLSRGVSKFTKASYASTDRELPPDDDDAIGPADATGLSGASATGMSGAGALSRRDGAAAAEATAPSAA